MQLSKKKNISQIFVAFLKSILNFKHLPKKMTLIAYVFPEIPVPKNMYRNTIGVRMTAPLKYLLITGKVVPLEKVFFSDTQIAKSAF